MLTVWSIHSVRAVETTIAFMADGGGTRTQMREDIDQMLLQKLAEWTISSFNWAGDIAYDGTDGLESSVAFGVSAYGSSTAGAANIPLFLAEGNHEAENASDVVTLRKMYNTYQGYAVPGINGPAGWNFSQMPNVYSSTTNYAYDVGDIRMIVLNQYAATTSDAINTTGRIHEQVYSWLKDEIKKTDKQHIAVMAHEPAYPVPSQTSGNHIGDALDADPANRDRFVNLLASYGHVNHFVGHTHISDLYEMRDNSPAEGDARTTTTTLDGGIWELDAGGFGDKAPGGGSNGTYPGIGYLHTNSAAYGDYEIRFVQGTGSPQWASPTVETVRMSDLTRHILVNTWHGAGTGTSSNGLFDMRYYVDYTSDVAANPDWSANNSGKWWEPAFNATTSSWTAGELGVGYRTDSARPGWINTPIDAFGGLATTTPQVYSIMQRVTFPATTTASYSNMTLHLDDDDGVMVWLNGTLILNTTNASVTPPTTGDGAEYFDKVQTVTTNGWAGTATTPTFTTYDVSAYKGSLVNGQNTLAVWNVNAGATSTDLGVAVRLSMSGAVDAVGPIISAVASSTPTPNTATVTWTTNEASNSQVEYGLTSSYTASTTVDATMVTSHSVPITGLATSTLYHYRVLSRDASNNLSASGDYTFTTPATTPSGPATTTLRQGVNGYSGYTDTYLNGSSTVTNYSATNPILIDGAAPYANALMKWDLSSIPSNATVTDVKIVYNVSNNSGVNTYSIYRSLVPWVANQANWASSTASTPWGLPGSLDDADDYSPTSLGTLGTAATGAATSTLNASGRTLVQNWISGATPNYGFFITRTTSADIDGLQFDSGEGATPALRPGLVVVYTVPSGPDTTPPVISSIASSTTSTTANITWTTNEAATSTISYGTTASYGSTTASTTLTTSHGTQLTGLVASTTYHFQISVVDAAGNIATSSDLTFFTTAPDSVGPVISSIASTTSTSTATVTWSTDEAANSKVVYGTISGTYSSNVNSGSLVTNHSQNITGLSASTTYYFRVVSADVEGNISTSSEVTFTTDLPQSVPVETILREGQNSYSGSIDTYINSGAVTTNNNAAAVVMADGEPDVNGLIKWDLSSLPADASVVSVKLVYNVANVTTNTYNLYRSLQTWTEGGATWNTYDGSTPWGTAGSLNSSTDYNPTVLGTVGVNALGLATSTLNSSGVAVVQGWIDGSLTNNGFLIADTVSTDSLQFDTTEHATVANRPALVITYTIPSGPDTTPPGISSVASSTTETTATITWTTNESATSTVDYGTTISYGNASSSNVAVTSHSIVLTGLNPSTSYHFRISSWDTSSNLSTTTDLVFTTATSEATSTAWWNASWGKRIKINLNNTQSVDLIDFPIRVALNSSRITYGELNATGTDVRFVDANGTTVLSHEIENWDTGTTSNLWVKVPKVNASSTADYIYMYYNNPSASSTATTTGVWNSNYKGVWHMKEDPSLAGSNILDSTSNAKHGSTSGAMTSGQSVAGQIGNALNLTGDDYVTMGSLGAMSSGRTVSMWINGNSWARTGTYDNSLYAFNTAPPTGGNSDIVRISTIGEVGFYNGATLLLNDSPVPINTAEWHHIVLVSSSTANASYIYQDGVHVATTSSWAPAVGATDVFYAGQEIDATVPSDFFNGKQDEIRVESIAQTPSWINAQFKTQNDTFQLYGSVESGTDTTGPVISSIASTTSTSTATTTWTTDENATSTLEYGLDTNYGTTATSSGNTSHQVVLTGLTPNTLYHYRITARDLLGNISTSTDRTFTTTDTTGPTVSMTAPTDGATVSGATVSLAATASDDVAVAGVQFKVDTNTNIGAEDTTSTYGVTWDSTGIADGVHTLIAVARDSAGNYATSSTVSVTVDNTAPVRSLASPSGSLGAGTTTVLISLATDEVASCKYSTSAASAFGSMTAFTNTSSTSHSSVVSGLTDNNTYTYYVKCQDGQSNVNATDYSISFSISSDVTPPVISSVASTTTAYTAAVTFNTNENSLVLVRYGTTTAYGSSTTLTSSASTNHTVNITGLLPLTLYHFQVEARDTLTNTATSSDATFTTIADLVSPTLSAIAASAGNSTSSISWTTDELASSRVQFGLSTSYGITTAETDTAPRVITHTVSMSDLAPCAIYHYRVISQDAYGNQATSTDQEFSTGGCTGDSGVGANEEDLIASSTGGSLELIQSGAGIGLAIPAGFAASSTFFQVIELDTDTVVASAGNPASGIEAVDGYMFRFNALVDNDTLITAFNATITVTVTYKDNDIGTFTESSLWIYRYNGSAWYPLSDCVVDTVANTVTCATTQFSDFTLGGALKPVVATTGGGGGIGSSGGSSPGILYVSTPMASSTTVVGATSTPAVAPVFTRNLSLGMTDAEVMVLQAVLNMDKDTRVALTGVGAPGKETSLFGGLTKVAVIKFQKKYKLPATGVVDVTTRAKLNQLYRPAVKSAGVLPTTVTGMQRFVQNLKVGDSHGEVRALQQILNSDPDTKIASVGVGAPGYETTTFGGLTKAALIKFQIKHKIIKNAQDPYAGTVGPGTRARLNLMLK